jgi:hypothetical protein
MYVSAFADEAADSLADQIRALKALGLEHLEARSIEGKNIHDLPEDRFEGVVEELGKAGIEVNCFGSTIANWGTSITTPFGETLEVAKRALKRMQRLHTPMIRIMSYAILLDEKRQSVGRSEGGGNGFRRLRYLTSFFLDGGVTPVHENCANYGGMSIGHTLRMLEQVPRPETRVRYGESPSYPGLFQTVPVPPCSLLGNSTRLFALPSPMYTSRIPIGKKTPRRRCTAGRGRVGEMSAESSWTSFETAMTEDSPWKPHMQVVYHDPSVTAPPERRLETFLEYGKRFLDLLLEVQAEVGHFP